MAQKQNSDGDITRKELIRDAASGRFNQLTDDSNDTNGWANIKRRGFIGGVAATIASVVGFSGAAAANHGPSDAEKRRIVQDYDTPDKARAALAQQRDLLQSLAEQNFLESPSVEALDIDTVNIPGRTADGDVIVDVMAADGEFTPEIKVFTMSPDRTHFTIGVFPELDQAYAVYTDGEDEIVKLYENMEELKAIHNSPTSGDVSTSSDWCNENDCCWHDWGGCGLDCPNKSVTCCPCATCYRRFCGCRLNCFFCTDGCSSCNPLC